MTKIGTYNTYLCMAMTFIAITLSCTKAAEPDGSNGHSDGDSGLEHVVIPANSDAAVSRVYFGENYPVLEWKKGDKVAVLGAKTGKQVFIAQNDGKDTHLEGDISKEDDILYAVYPYDENVNLPTAEELGKATDKNVEIMRVTIPDVQYATPGSFDPTAYSAVVRSDRQSFSFKTVGSFFRICFEEDGDKVKSVKIVANDSPEGKTVTIAATAGLKFDEDENPVHGLGGTWGKSSNTIMLVEAEGHQFCNGTFFISTRANSCPYGITAYVEYDDGTVYKKTSDKEVFDKGARNSVINLGRFDKADGFQHEMDGQTLLDYSYAGYRYSEEVPAEAETTGYNVFDVTDYGAVANDGKSDREAFLQTISAAVKGSYELLGNGNLRFKHQEKANAIIYFPEGEFILHTSDDDTDGKSHCIQIRSGNLIIKGAGRDKTTLVMQDPNLPTDNSKLYSSPVMMQIKHDTGLGAGVSVTKDSRKGTFSIHVADASGFSVGQWVCLDVRNKDAEFVSEQMYPYTAESDWKIVTDGVQVNDYHKIKAIDGNKITFHEPLMTDVKAKYKWQLHNFPHYENIGIEDLSFKGNAKSDFIHHGSWEDDGAYKPISLQRVTDSWIRRVGFISTSEACSIINSANVSAYDIVMSGNRGHAAVRSQASARVLIAATEDNTYDNKGNYHGVGVSQQSIGTVLWRNTWGDDSCFESHATQPRATLIDCCSGGWHKYHAGGDAKEVPHHLSDLVIWNFTATAVGHSDFTWWGDKNWMFLPPVIAGFNGPATFPDEEAHLIDTGGIESLFEFQLADRLGYLPDWIEELK